MVGTAGIGSRLKRIEYISKILWVPLQVSHRAVLNVDERGTTAAASTIIEVLPMSMPETMKLDRPFLVFIVEESTKSLLFMGKINDPTAM